MSRKQAIDTLKLLRMLSVTALLLTIGDFAIRSFLWERMDETMQTFISLSGYGAVVDVPGWSYNTYYALQIVLLGAVALFLERVRWLFVANVVLILAMGALFGAVVSTANEIVSAIILSYIYGALLVLLFLRSS